MHRSKKLRSLWVPFAVAFALGCLAQPVFADPDQGGEGPGTPGTGEAGPGESGPPSDGPGTDTADDNRSWVEYWHWCISHTDRPDWAQGEAEACSEAN